MCRLLEAAGLEAIAERRLTGGVATLYEGVRGGGDRTVVSGGAG
jgi:hypothetical protein